MSAPHPRGPQALRTVVITRPKAKASPLASSLASTSSSSPLSVVAPSPLETLLHREGYPTKHLPLIDIAGPPEPRAIEDLRDRCHLFQAIMFVSPQAVRHFFRHLKADMSAWTTPCWVTGGGSQEALLDCGVPASLIYKPEDDSGSWDSEHLWLRVHGEVSAGQRVLIVRGQEASPAMGRERAIDKASSWVHGHATAEMKMQGVGREYMSQKLEEKGVLVSYLVAYERGVPQWSPSQIAQVRELLEPSCVWLFTSSQAAKNLAELLKPVDFSRALALATHERIAKELVQLGFGVVLLSLPGAEDVKRSLESLP